MALKMNYWSKETIEKIRKGFYSAVYFNRTQYILEQEKNFTPVTMQVFQWNDKSILCGIDEVVELLKAVVDTSLAVRALRDGDIINQGESVMHITGSYVSFAHLESIYLGILARRTVVATTTRRVVRVANGKPVFFFADRFDYFLNQEGDGYAAYIGGASGVCTLAHASRFNGTPVGTIPHALIAVCGGDTVRATQIFAKHIRDANVVALVDFDNDCVGTSLAVAKILGKKLWGVRLDTASNMIDKSLKAGYGVTPHLVKLVRRALNDKGFSHVKILVSGGFSEEKVRRFEKAQTPVDGYGVGSALIHGSNDFTADIVMVNGKKIAKAGRRYTFNKSFHEIK